MTPAKAPQAYLNITVKLGSTLRDKVPRSQGGECTITLPVSGPAHVSDVMTALGLREGDVNLIYRNHVAVTSQALVSDGDRVAFFPPTFIHFSQFYIRRGDT
jgi:molybdopterin converting factor small subunit